MGRNKAFVQPGFRITTDQNRFSHSLSKTTRCGTTRTRIPRRTTRPTLRLLSSDSGGGGRGGSGRRDDGDNNEDNDNYSNDPPPFLASALSTQRANDSLLPSWARRLSITTILLTLTIFVFLLQLYFGDRLTSTFMKHNGAIASGEWYRLFTPMFLHGGFTHLLVNCLSLHYTGPVVEGWFGKRRFIALYLFSGFCGNVASFLATPHPGVGASGAIFGLIGGFAVLLLRHRDLIGRQSQSALQSLALTVAINFAIGLSPGSYIDNFAHLGGMLGGLAFAYIAGPRLRPVRSVRGTYLIDRPVYREAASEIRHKWDSLVKRLF